MTPWWMRPAAPDEEEAQEEKQEQARKQEKKGGGKGDRPSARKERRQQQTKQEQKGRSRQRGDDRSRQRGKETPRRSARQQEAPRGDRRVAFLLCAPSDAELVPGGDPGRALERLFSRLERMGSVVVKRAYGDWDRAKGAREALSRAGVELVDVGGGEQERAEVQVVADALEFCYAEEPADTFVLGPGEIDLSALVEKLRDRGKRVLAVGNPERVPATLREACDEFLAWELDGRAVRAEKRREAEEQREAAEEEREAAEPERQRRPATRLQDLDPEERKALLGSLRRAVLDLAGSPEGTIWATQVRQMLQRQGGFPGDGYGHDDFAALLEDAQRAGVLRLEKHPRTDTYLITGLAAADD